MMWIAWLVRHDADVLSANAVTAIVFVENNFFLQQHHQFTCFAMFLKKFFHGPKLVYILPSTACERFHVCGKSDVFKNMIPVQRKGQVGERLVTGICRMISGWKQDSFWNRHANFRGEAIVKKFLICAPPKWVIDH